MQQPIQPMYPNMQPIQPMYSPPPQPMYPMYQPPVQSTSGISTGVKLFVAVVVVVLLAYLLKPDFFSFLKSDPAKPVEVTAVSNPTPSPVVVDNPAAGVVNNAPPTVVVQAPVPAPVPAAPSTPVYTPISTPVFTPISTPAPTPVPAVDQNLTASIVFTKNSAGKTAPVGEDSHWKTFQIGELRAYDTTGRLLNDADFSSVDYKYGSFGFPARNIIDGNPNTFSHTYGAQDIHQMTLILRNPVNISRVQILNRHDGLNERLKDTVCEFKRANGSIIKQFVLTSDMTQNLSL